MNHIGTRPIETQRLLLRGFTPADAADAHLWLCDPDVAMYMHWDAHTELAQTEAFIADWVESYEKPSFYRWAIVPKEEGRAVGAIGFYAQGYDAVADCAYSLRKAYWNRGIVSEALTAVLRYALLDVGLNRVEAFHAIANPGSGRVMQKAGMQYEGRARQKYRSHKGFEDCDLYAILREDLP